MWDTFVGRGAPRVPPERERPRAIPRAPTKTPPMPPEARRGWGGAWGADGLRPGPVPKLAQPVLIWSHLWRGKHSPKMTAFDWTSTPQTSPTRTATASTASLLGANRDAHAPAHPLRRTFSCTAHASLCPPPRSQELIKKLSGPPELCGFRDVTARRSGGAQGRERRRGRGVHLEGCVTRHARARAILRASGSAVCARVRRPHLRCALRMAMILGAQLA